MPYASFARVPSLSPVLSRFAEESDERKEVIKVPYEYEA